MTKQEAEKIADTLGKGIDTLVLERASGDWRVYVEVAGEEPHEVVKLRATTPVCYWQTLEGTIVKWFLFFLTVSYVGIGLSFLWQLVK